MTDTADHRHSRARRRYLHLREAVRREVDEIRRLPHEVGLFVEEMRELRHERRELRRQLRHQLGRARLVEQRVRQYRSLVPKVDQQVRSETAADEEIEAIKADLEASQERQRVLAGLSRELRPYLVVSWVVWCVHLAAVGAVIIGVLIGKWLPAEAACVVLGLLLAGLWLQRRLEPGWTVPRGWPNQSCRRGEPRLQEPGRGREP